MNRADAIIKRLDVDKEAGGAEIGVYKGKLSSELLERLPNLCLFMIDRWAEYSQKEKSGNKFSVMSQRNQDSFDAAHKKAEAVKVKYEPRAFIFKMDSVSASGKFKNGVLDFVFIDAGHSFYSVVSDIEAWVPKIKPGGWICGHDYHRPSVAEAVHYFFGREIELDIDNTWFKRL